MVVASNLNVPGLEGLKERRAQKGCGDRPEGEPMRRQTPCGAGFNSGLSESWWANRQPAGLRGGANLAPSGTVHAPGCCTRQTIGRGVGGRGCLGGCAEIGWRSLEASGIGYWAGGRFEWSRPMAVDLALRL